MRKMLLIAGLVLAGCNGCGDGDGQAPVAVVDSGPCSVTAIATVQGCGFTGAIPLNAFAYPVDFSALTLYVDTAPVARDLWQPTNDGHTVTFVRPYCTEDGQAHLVSASVGCRLDRVDCSVSYGCR